jgi:hypothetical protein
MLKVYFGVEVATQLSGYESSVNAATAAEIIEKNPMSTYDGYGIDPFSYCLKKEGNVICEGTYDTIVEKLKRME